MNCVGSAPQEGLGLRDWGCSGVGFCSEADVIAQADCVWCSAVVHGAALFGAAILPERAVRGKLGDAGATALPLL